jgi:hypothetical protein
LLPNVKMPYVQQWNVGNDMGMDINYVGNQYTQQFEAGLNMGQQIPNPQGITGANGQVIAVTRQNSLRPLSTLGDMTDPVEQGYDSRYNALHIRPNIVPGVDPIMPGWKANCNSPVTQTCPYINLLAIFAPPATLTLDSIRMPHAQTYNMAGTVTPTVTPANIVSSFGSVSTNVGGRRTIQLGLKLYF